MVVTDRQRLLIGEQSSLGTLRNQRAFSLGGIKLEQARAEQQGLALKLNPIAKAFPSPQTFSIRLDAGGERLHLGCVTHDLVTALGARQAASATA